ncbi:hypothetical protein K474DRAFT_1681021, partial [Panus rudis PR-1116 ss-1]
TSASPALPAPSEPRIPSIPAVPSTTTDDVTRQDPPCPTPPVDSEMNPVSPAPPTTARGLSELSDLTDLPSGLLSNRSSAPPPVGQSQKRVKTYKSRSVIASSDEDDDEVLGQPEAEDIEMEDSASQPPETSTTGISGQSDQESLVTPKTGRKRAASQVSPIQSPTRPRHAKRAVRMDDVSDPDSPGPSQPAPRTQKVKGFKAKNKRALSLAMHGDALDDLLADDIDDVGNDGKGKGKRVAHRGGRK